MLPDVIMGKSQHCSCRQHVSWHVAVMSAYWKLTCQLGGLANMTWCWQFQLSCYPMIMTNQWLGQLEGQQMSQRKTWWRSCDDPDDHWWRSCDSPSDNLKTTLKLPDDPKDYWWLRYDYPLDELVMTLQNWWWNLMTFDDPPLATFIAKMESCLSCSFMIHTSSSRCDVSSSKAYDNVYCFSDTFISLWGSCSFDMQPLPSPSMPQYIFVNHQPTSLMCSILSWLGQCLLLPFSGHL